VNVEAAPRAVEREVLELALEVGLHVQQLEPEHLGVGDERIGPAVAGADRLVDEGVGLRCLLSYNADGMFEDVALARSHARDGSCDDGRPRRYGRAVAPDPVERLRQACLAAIERCAAKEGEGVDPDTFAELGESLFWLVALAEANRRHRAPGLILGLTWARNRIAHGALLTAPVKWRYGSETGKLALDRSALGVSSAHLWLPRTEIVTSEEQRPDPNGEAAYDEHLSGGEVLATLRSGLAEATGGRL